MNLINSFEKRKLLGGSRIAVDKSISKKIAARATPKIKKSRSASKAKSPYKKVDDFLHHMGLAIMVTSTVANNIDSSIQHIQRSMMGPKRNTNITSLESDNKFSPGGSKSNHNDLFRPTMRFASHAYRNNLVFGLPWI